MSRRSSPSFDSEASRGEINFSELPPPRITYGLNPDQIEQVRQIAREEIVAALTEFVNGAVRGAR